VSRGNGVRIRILVEERGPKGGVTQCYRRKDEWLWNVDSRVVAKKVKFRLEINEISRNYYEISRNYYDLRKNNF
jgi:hypothetical protein